MILFEKYALQDKQYEINQLAKEIYDRVMPIAKSLYIINEADIVSSDYELDRLYNLKNNGDKNAKYILDLNDYLNEEDDEAIVFRKVLNDIAPNPVYVRVFIIGYDSNQTGGFDPNDKAVSIYFPFKQYKTRSNNFDLNRLKKTLMHEFTHAVDYMNDYYTTKARKIIPNALSEKDRALMKSVSPYLYDVLYRLWHDSELNAQQITIDDNLVSCLQEGIDALRNTTANHAVFALLRRILPPTRENISENRFKNWFITNSEKRLNKLLNKKRKNDINIL